MIILLGVLGLMIGVGTFFGVKYFQKAEQEQLFIGEMQLQILAQDKELSAERFFVQEAAPFAVSSAVFRLGQSGGLNSASECGLIEGKSVWLKNRTRQRCLPGNSTPQHLATHIEESIKHYVNSIDVPTEYVVSVHNTTVGSKKIIGKAMNLSVHNISNGQLAGNLSFKARLDYDLNDYGVLRTAAEALWQSIPGCMRSNTLNECVGKGIEDANQQQNMRQAQLELHYGDCHFDTATEQQKLRAETGKQYVLCALKSDGKKWLAYDATSEILEERELEYWFGIDFS